MSPAEIAGAKRPAIIASLRKPTCLSRSADAMPRSCSFPPEALIAARAVGGDIALVQIVGFGRAATILFCPLVDALQLRVAVRHPLIGCGRAVVAMLGRDAGGTAIIGAPRPGCGEPFFHGALVLVAPAALAAIPDRVGEAAQALGKSCCKP